jgi:ubiquinone/menaquinone biosynthesis C-methylase UbiE
MGVDLQKQEVNRAVWSAGDWDRVADYVKEVGPRLLDAVEVDSGMRLLDIGTGSGGSIAIPAAERGAEVVGSDITSNWFDAARRRASEAGVDVEWVEADALDLPFEDRSFDRVCSSFGHMFAPDHALCAAEMVRVTKPGGVIGFNAWTPEGTTGQMFRLTGSHMPPPPEGFQPPPTWGSEEHVRQMFEPHGLNLNFERRMNDFREESLQLYLDTFGSNFGPMVTARAVLGDEGWTALRGDLDALFDRVNKATDGTVHIEGEYLEVVARKPADG